MPAPWSHAHLTPNPAPLRAPGGGGAHDCTGGLEAVGRGVANSVALETASERRELRQSEGRRRALSGTRGSPRTRPGPTRSAARCAPAAVSAPTVAPLGTSEVTSEAGEELGATTLAERKAKVTSPLLPATPLHVTSGNRRARRGDRLPVCPGATK